MKARALPMRTAGGSAEPAHPQTAPGAARPTHVRHVVLALTVAAYMITYIDRVAISSAIPFIRKEFGFSLITIGWILSAFRWTYALFQIPGGWLGDYIGPRRAMALVVGWWSMFTCFTAFAWNAVSMVVIRALFGLGEAGAFPIATRALSRWMLPSERGFAQGITHAGSRLGAAITPVLVVALIMWHGWRAPFLLLGIVGIVWALIWFVYYRNTPREHAGVNMAELNLIQRSIGELPARTAHSVPWRTILASGNLWRLCAMYFCYCYCLSVYLDWFPTYLKSHRKFTLEQMGIYASLPLFAGTLGDLLGGWISDILLKRTQNVTFARRVVSVIGFTIATAAIIPATFTRSSYACVWYSCIAFFGLELTVGVSWAIALDIGGDYSGSVSALMNMCGNIGGAISPALLAYLVKAYS
ncbi:MAG: MFS transporter, partial [Acidobacteriaceae bacterium]|nr:MFS transporter [Acidobacteriaceae bacterium]